MNIILFTKTMKSQDHDSFHRVTEQLGIDGYALCIRDEFPINPGNIATVLPRLTNAGINVEMVVGPGDLIDPDDPMARLYLSSMADSGVELLKLGYMFYKPDCDGDYWSRFKQLKSYLAGWQDLAREYNVKVCYHTHCGVRGLNLGFHMGTSTASLMHLLDGLDPDLVGAYIDPGCLLMSGESFPLALEMSHRSLAAVALQEALCVRQPQGDEGVKAAEWPPAGQGMVMWSEVISGLARYNFQGPLVIHAEFEAVDGQEYDAVLRHEVEYFKEKRMNVIASTNG